MNYLKVYLGNNMSDAYKDVDKLFFEKEYWNKGYQVVGLDEAGRGPLCGPLVVCGVSFLEGYINLDINDSKKLSAKKREQLFKVIINDCQYFKIVIINPREIDRLNILGATRFGMQLIADDFKGAVLTDCVSIDCDVYEPLVKGDSRSLSIAAASILAKVIRDKIMDAYHILYPEYGFNKHKGYPTKKHIEALNAFGVIDIYRYTYGPVSKLLRPKTLF